MEEYPIDFDEAGFIEAEQGLKFPDVEGTEMLFRSYFDAQYDMLTTVKPAVVGHFDLVRMYRQDYPLSDHVWTRIKRNIDYIAEYEGVVEINSRAFKKGLRNPYPLQDIMDYMKEKHIRFTLSDDSHGPKDVAMHYKRLLDYLLKNDVHEVWFPKPKSDLGRDDDPYTKVQIDPADPFWAQFS